IRCWVIRCWVIRCPVIRFRAAADGHVAREIPRRHASPAFAARKRITGHRITQHRITQHRITERGHTT
ncbi:hypothetical protein CWD85_08565, partial [Burkholderia pseudomallei]